MRTRRRVVAAKIEAVEGTAETLAAEDGGILAIDSKFSIDAAKLPRNAATGSLSKLNDLIGKVSAKITFRAEMKGAGAAYSATVKPALSQYLRSVGFAETVDTTSGSETVTYDKASTGVPSLTMACYKDGIIQSIRGARGTYKIAGVCGENVFVDFEFTGVYNGTIDGAVLSPTIESTIPPKMLSVPFSYDSITTFVNSSFSIDGGNQIALRPDMSKAEGYISAMLTDRDVRGKVDPEMELVATYDFLGKMLAENKAALSIGDIGSTQYNKFTITGPQVSITDVQESEREGLDVADLSLQFGRNAGDDEIQIVFD